MTRRRQPTRFLLPVTGFENDGQPVTPPGFDKEYWLYPTIDASGILGTNGAPNLYTSLNVILRADPNSDAGTVTSTVENDAMFNTVNGTFTEPNGTFRVGRIGSSSRVSKSQPSMADPWATAATPAGVAE